MCQNRENSRKWRLWIRGLLCSDKRKWKVLFFFYVLVMFLVRRKRRGGGTGILERQLTDRKKVISKEQVYAW